MNSDGFCKNCGRVDDRTANGKAFCTVCAQRRNNARRKLYYTRIDEHKCTRCGKVLPDDYWYIDCVACREAARVAYKKKKTAQGGNSETV